MAWFDNCPELDSVEDPRDRAAILAEVERRVTGKNRRVRVLEILFFPVVIGTLFLLTTLLSQLGTAGRVRRTITVTACFIVFGLAAAGAGLVFYRQRRRELRLYLRELGFPFCLKCGYSLKGQTEPRCPECAEPFDPVLLTPTDNDA